MCDTDTRDDISTTEYLAPDGTRYRVRIVRDEAASSPRENDNATVMHTFDRSYISPDGGKHGRASDAHPLPLIPSDYIEDGAVDMRRATRWVNLFGKDAGVLAIAPLYRVLGGWAEGSLEMRGTSATGGYASGYVAITAQSWEMCMGDSPLEGKPGSKTPSAAEVMAQDVAEYNRWAQGEFVGYIVEASVLWVQSQNSDVEMSTWELIPDGVGVGIDLGDDEHQRQYGNYALTEAVALLPEGSVPA